MKLLVRTSMSHYVLAGCTLLDDGLKRQRILADTFDWRSVWTPSPSLRIFCRSTGVITEFLSITVEISCIFIRKASGWVSLNWLGWAGWPVIASLHHSRSTQADVASWSRWFTQTLTRFANRLVLVFASNRKLPPLCELSTGRHFGTSENQRN